MPLSWIRRMWLSLDDPSPASVGGRDPPCRSDRAADAAGHGRGRSQTAFHVKHGHPCPTPVASEVQRSPYVQTHVATLQRTRCNLSGGMCFT